jgi:hypothetical protein
LSGSVSLQPHLEIDGCLFMHVELWLDPRSVEDLWDFHSPPDSSEKLARSFAAVPHRVLFIGHLHRWLLGTPMVCWRGAGSIRWAWTAATAILLLSMLSGKAGVPCSTQRPAT